MSIELTLKHEASIIARNVKLGMARYARYQPKIDQQYQCPICWVTNEFKSGLRSVPSGSDDHDLLRCNSCDADLVIPL